MANNYLFPSQQQTVPFSNINLKYAGDGTHYPGNFGSNESSIQFGLPGALRNNAQAANASRMVGGKNRKYNKKNITNKYKCKRMTLSKRRGLKIKTKTKTSMKKTKRIVKGKSKSKRAKSSSRRNVKTMNGGAAYHQFGSQIPSNASYSTGGVLSAKDSMLANPAPFQKITGNVVDNYNYNTNKGFQFW